MAAARRNIASAALELSLKGAIRPIVTRPFFGVTARCLSTSTSKRKAPLLRLPNSLKACACTGSHVKIAARSYSKDQSSGGIPESKKWSFDEMVDLANDSNRETVIVDVREPHELFETGKIPGAINIPITSAVQSFHLPDDEFNDMYGFDRPSHDTPMVFYCKAGVRAKGAAGLAQHAGWKSVGEYSGSWLEWAEKKGPVEKVTKGGS